MTLEADFIDQQGILLAPLGTINLTAADTLTLQSGSVTSVSADGQLIPYGVSGFGGLNFSAPGSVSTKQNETAGLSLNKKVNLKADKIDTQTGATVDISGGGDTLSYEFINGIGGSADILGQAGVYAILPSAQEEYAPFDVNYLNPEIKLGDAVYLSGLPGISEGTYTLLPARYALLPGAFMVQTSSTSLLPGQSKAQLNGSTLVSGYFTTLEGSTRDVNNSTFRITDGSVFRTNYGTKDYKGPAEYRLNTGNTFITKLSQNSDVVSIPRLAKDAGQLVLEAESSIALDGNLLTGRPDTGRGALVDIVADNLKVVSTEGAAVAGVVQVRADALSALDADSLLLGGTRSISTNGQTITTSADNVTFANDVNYALQVNELIATAKDAVKLESNATVIAVSENTAIGTETLNASGDGALLAVSAVNDLTFNRTSGVGTVGTLDIDGGSSISAARSLVLDSTLTTSLDGAVNVANGGSATLSANRIQLGNPAVVNGMLVDDAFVTSLGNLSLVTLNSKQNIEVHGATTFGNDNLDVTFNTSGITGNLAVGENVTITSDTFTLKNTTGVTSVANAGNGTFNVAAETVVIEGRALSATGTPVIGIGGFETVNLTANGEAKFSGVGETQINAATTNITSARLTATHGALNTLKASGVLNTIANVVNPSTLAVANQLGGNLTLQAASLNLGGNIELPSGQLTAIADTGDLNVTGTIKATSVPVTFDRYIEYTPGGGISLESKLGNVSVATGATLDVSGAGDADAGVLTMRAVSTTKTANFNGVILGNAGLEGGLGGRFVLDVNGLADYSALNTKLNVGGFNSLQDIRIRSGDLTIANGVAINAHQFLLGVDAGKIDIAGTVNADAISGGSINGGSIEIYARDNITLKSTGLLSAKGLFDAGKNVAGKGGEVLLSSLSRASINAISAESGGLIDVSGGQQGVVTGSKGDVTMRAYRGTSGTANTVNVAFSATGAVKGASEVRLEGVRVYESTSFTATTPNIVADTNNFYTANPAAGSYVATQDSGSIRILPHIEVRSDNTNPITVQDMSVGATATDLNMRAFGALQVGKGGTLTLRANGNLNINGSLSDSYSTATTTGIFQSGNSFSYNLVAGADFNAANSMATSRSTTSGNLVLASNKLIRTGTGDIRIATGGNLTMGNNASVIYTVGRSATPLTGFTNPANTNNGVAALTATSGLYLTDGGDIDIAAQGNITGQFATNGNQQTVNNWLFRQAAGKDATKQVSWWVRPDLFRQGVGALGGGNVSIRAGGSITNFSASSATTARYASDTSFVVNGGGDVKVTAGGDINSGIYYAGQGDIRILSGGEIKSSSTSGSNATFGMAIALQDANVKVSAVRGARIDAVYNPTLWVQATGNILNSSATGNLAIPTTDRNGYLSHFVSMPDSSAIRLGSLAGNVKIGSNSSTPITSDVTGLIASNPSAAQASALNIYPATVQARAFSGDIDVLSSMVLIPSAKGNLSLLAAGNLSTIGSVVLSDVASMPTATYLAELITASQPRPEIFDAASAVLIPLVNNHAAVAVHQGDANPVEMVARDGNITLSGGLTGISGLEKEVSEGQKETPASLVSSKAVYINAGRDIKINRIDIQHLSANDISAIHAGRDYIQIGSAVATPADTGLRISGAGNLLVEAGRNVNLGDSAGIQSVSNTPNPNLSSEGASITVLAGLGKDGADLATYINTYLVPSGVGPATLQGDATKLAEYRKATAEVLTEHMRKVSNDASLSEADALADYLALDADRQAIFAYRHFSSELLASGKGFAESGNHDRGDSAIAALFPESRAYSGDLSLFNSQIRTLRDGSIDVLAPGGLINVGVPSSNPDAEIGIVTRFGGDIRAFTETGFQVEQSKVIAQYGSNITVWANNGDIDAGRGSKSALSASLRSVSTDSDGNTSLSITPSTAGSGIRAQTYDTDGPNKPEVAPDLGDVALIAPRGVLNAGEAGIAAGNFLAVATQVIGGDNIQVSGTSSGVPAADTGGLTGSVGNVGNVADATKSVAEDVARNVAQNNNPFTTKNFLPSFISVEVIGLGN